jgi:hypothetical protein
MNVLGVIFMRKLWMSSNMCPYCHFHEEIMDVLKYVNM